MNPAPIRSALALSLVCLGASCVTEPATPEGLKRKRVVRSYTDDEKTKLEGEIHRIVTTRDPKFTNFVEASGLR